MTIEYQKYKFCFLRMWLNSIPGTQMHRPSGVIGEYVNSYIPLGRLSGRLQSPGWLLTLHVTWCLIWCYRIEKVYGHTWHQMAFAETVSLPVQDSNKFCGNWNISGEFVWNLFILWFQVLFCRWWSLQQLVWKEGLPLLGYESHVSQSLTTHVKACLALVKTYTSPLIGSMFLLMQNSLCY